MQAELVRAQLRVLETLHALAVEPPRVRGAAAAAVAAAAARRRRGLPPTPPPPSDPIVAPFILSAHLEALTKVMIEHATDDTTTGATRVTALLSLERLLKAGRTESAERLKSFEAMGGDSRKATLGPSWLRAANRVYPALLGRMQDPHQEVCAAAMSTMAEVLFFVSPGAVAAEPGEGWISLRALLETMTPLAFVQTSYDEPTDYGADGGLAELAEHLLRQAAVLDPAVFVEVVEQANAQPDKRCQAYEDLLEHGRLLISFSSSSRGGDRGDAGEASEAGQASALPFDVSTAMSTMAFSTDGEVAGAGTPGHRHCRVAPGRGENEIWDAYLRGLARAQKVQNLAQGSLERNFRYRREEMLGA